MNAISRAYRKFTASTAELESEELRDKFGNSGGIQTQLIGQCEPGAQVEVVGSIRSVSIAPSSKSPALEIELYDGSGVVTVVWMGRRMIPGIVAGRTVKVCGRLTCNADRPIIFNPRYELRPLPR
jgi:RecG-like helicase